MATLKHSVSDHQVLSVAAAEPVKNETVEEGRARRVAALKKVAGIWSQRMDIPADGLDYLRQLHCAIESS